MVARIYIISITGRHFMAIILLFLNFIAFGLTRPRLEPTIEASTLIITPPMQFTMFRVLNYYKSRVYKESSHLICQTYQKDINTLLKVICRMTQMTKDGIRN